MSINDWSASSIATLAPKVPTPLARLPGVIFLSPENRGCFGFGRFWIVRLEANHPVVLFFQRVLSRINIIEAIIFCFEYNIFFQGISLKFELFLLVHIKSSI